MMKNVAYYLLYSIVYLLSLLPFWLLYLLSDGLFVLVYHVAKYRRKIVWKNLSESFPEKDGHELHIIEKEFYQWLCDYIVETIKLLTISDKELLRRFEFRGTDQVDQCFEEGQDCAGILGHYCNWEWLSGACLNFKRDPNAILGLIYHPLYNEVFDRLFFAIRSSHRGLCVPKKDILRHLVKLRRENRRSLFGYISDQAPKWENMHLWVQFLNHDTPVFTGGERIMRKMNNAIYYIDMERPRRGYYICTYKLITRQPNTLPENAITAEFFKLLEQSIRRQPAYYLWTHNRWKRGREEFERKYDIIDGKIIRKEEYK